MWLVVELDMTLLKVSREASSSCRTCEQLSDTRARDVTMMPLRFCSGHVDLALRETGRTEIRRANLLESTLVTEVSEIVHSKAQCGGANLRECV